MEDRIDQSPEEDDTEGQRRTIAAEESEEDTEGHRRRVSSDEGEDDTEGQSLLIAPTTAAAGLSLGSDEADEDDTEGHRRR